MTDHIRAHYGAHASRASVSPPLPATLSVKICSFCPTPYCRLYTNFYNFVPRFSYLFIRSARDQNHTTPNVASGLVRAKIITNSVMLSHRSQWQSHGSLTLLKVRSYCLASEFCSGGSDYFLIPTKREFLAEPREYVEKVS